MQLGTPVELIDAIYDRGLPGAAVAGLADLVQKAALAGDAVAADILSRAAGELVAAAASVVTRLGNEFGQEADGKVVDTGVAGVFEHAQRDGFAGAGNAGDEDDFQHGHDCGTLFQDDAGGIASDMAINSRSAPVAPRAP